MSKLVLLDTGVLGKATHPKKKENQAPLQWLNSLLSTGHKVYIPEIADYELRRSLIRISSTSSLRKLDSLSSTLGYLCLTTAVMRKAAELWAHARNTGQATAGDDSIDGDVILCAQAELLGNIHIFDNVIVATTNVGHLNRFVTADDWTNISP